jgi:quaternary ammonium compound-resistance protein SugE
MLVDWKRFAGSRPLEVLCPHDDASKRGKTLTGWFALLLAGLLEIAWALGLKYSDGLTRLWPSVAMLASIALSFALLAIALKSVPFGTAYAMWTGIGAAGTVIIGMVLFGEPADPVRVTCLTLIVAGMIGLKLASDL